MRTLLRAKPKASVVVVTGKCCMLKGGTASQWAAQIGPLGPIEALLEHGAALDATANGSHSAMMVAVEKGNLPAADLLLRAACPPACRS
jgi:ankyrin repeat protein